MLNAIMLNKAKWNILYTKLLTIDLRWKKQSKNVLKGSYLHQGSPRSTKK